MKLETRERRAAEAARRWRRQYFKDDRWVSTFSGSSEDIYRALRGLGQSPDPDKVDGLIGNESWTEIECDLCDESVETAAVMEADGRGITICQPCSKKVAALFPA
jgi:hypothetical protein